MTKRFIIGDNHFGDPRILRYCRSDMFNTVTEMDNYMLTKWNDTVKAKDIVFINGDLSRYTEESDYKFIQNLNGKKILIRGNHDTMSDDIYLRNGIFKVYDYPIMYDFLLISHVPFFVNDNTPFANVYAHIHNNRNYNKYSANGYCTSVEVNDYIPVDIDIILKSISSERKQLDIALTKEVWNER